MEGEKKEGRNWSLLMRVGIWAMECSLSADPSLLWRGKIMLLCRLGRGTDLTDGGPVDSVHAVK